MSYGITETIHVPTIHRWLERFSSQPSSIACSIESRAIHFSTSQLHHTPGQAIEACERRGASIESAEAKKVNANANHNRFRFCSRAVSCIARSARLIVNYLSAVFGSFMEYRSEANSNCMSFGPGLA
jgi:hypothetical protein